MREWTEKHILELIKKVAAENGISQGGSGSPNYGVGLFNADLCYFNLLMNPQLISAGELNGQDNYAAVTISGPVMFTNYYSDTSGKAYGGENAKRPLVGVNLIIQLHNIVAGPFSNTVVGYILDQPIEITEKIRIYNLVWDDIAHDYTKVFSHETSLPKLDKLKYDPLNLLNFEGENGEIVSCSKTTIQGNYMVFQNEDDYRNGNRTITTVSVPAYEVRVTCNAVTSLPDNPLVIGGVVEL